MSEKTVVFGLLAMVAAIAAIGMVSEYLSGGSTGLTGYNSYWNYAPNIGSTVQDMVCKRANACPQGAGLYINGADQQKCPVTDASIPYCSHDYTGRVCSSFNQLDSARCVFQ